MKLTLEKAKAMMGQNNNGNLDLIGTKITALPDNLTVGGNLYLRGTRITALPDNLTVGGWLDLSNTKITALPDNLTVGGNLYLRGTRITELPDNLTVGGWLDLSNTKITALPDNLTVGGNLYLRGTRITELPDNLTVGGGLDLRGTGITNPTVKRLRHGEYVPGQYLYADGILTHIKKKKKIGEYTLFVGKIPNRHVIFDGKHYAHCRNFHEGRKDLRFKAAKDRGADQYRGISLDDSFTEEELETMYRIITGACQQGTQAFVDGLKERKKRRTIRETFELTEGQYGAEEFRAFFEGANE